MRKSCGTMRRRSSAFAPWRPILVVGIAIWGALLSTSEGKAAGPSESPNWVPSLGEDPWESYLRQPAEDPCPDGCAANLSSSDSRAMESLYGFRPLTSVFDKPWSRDRVDYRRVAIDGNLIVWAHRSSWRAGNANESFAEAEKLLAYDVATAEFHVLGKMRQLERFWAAKGQVLWTAFPQNPDDRHLKVLHWNASMPTPRQLELLGGKALDFYADEVLGFDGRWIVVEDAPDEFSPERAVWAVDTVANSSRPLGDDFEPAGTSTWVMEGALYWLQARDNGTTSISWMDLKNLASVTTYVPVTMRLDFLANYDLSSRWFAWEHGEDGRCDVLVANLQSGTQQSVPVPPPGCARDPDVGGDLLVYVLLDRTRDYEPIGCFGMNLLTGSAFTVAENTQDLKCGRVIRTDGELVAASLERTNATVFHQTGWGLYWKPLFSPLPGLPGDSVRASWPTGFATFAALAGALALRLPDRRRMAP